MKVNLFSRMKSKLSHSSLTLAVLCMFTILCFRFPEYLTTPEIRSSYPIELFREILRWALGASALLAGLGALFSNQRRLSFFAVAVLIICSWLGGADVPLKDEYSDGAIQLGLDWFVLNLFLLAIVFIPLEALFPLVKQQKLVRPEFKVDLVYFAVGHLGVQFIALINQKPVEYWVQRIDWHPFAASLQSSHIVLQIFIALLVSDLVQYWVHRSFHEIPWLWRFHKIHHSIKTLDWLAGSRIHLFEILLVRGVVYFAVLMLGVSYDAFLIYLVIVSFHAVLNHTNIKMNLGPIEYLIASNRFHHWHHNDRPETYDKNYAVHFPFLDRLFGTYYFPKNKWPGVYGIEKDQYPNSYLGQFIHPFKNQ